MKKTQFLAIIIAAVLSMPFVSYGQPIKSTFPCLPVVIHAELCDHSHENCDPCNSNSRVDIFVFDSPETETESRIANLESRGLYAGVGGFGQFTSSFAPIGGPSFTAKFWAKDWFVKFALSYREVDKVAQTFGKFDVGFLVTPTENYDTRLSIYVGGYFGKDENPRRNALNEMYGGNLGLNFQQKLFWRANLDVDAGLAYGKVGELDEAFNVLRGTKPALQFQMAIIFH